MTTFTRLSRAVLGIASGYAIATAPASALAEQPDTAGAFSELEELLQWHNGLSIESNVCVAPQRESAFSSRKLPEMAALLALHGAPGTWDVMQSSASVSAENRSRKEQAPVH